jgi:hypothetical protein
MSALHTGQGEAEALDSLIAVLGATHPAVGALRERRFLHRALEPHPF